MQKKIRFHKTYDYDLIYLLISNPEYPIRDVIRNCIKSYVNDEKYDFPALTKVADIKEEELPKEIVVCVTFFDEESCNLLKKMKDRQFNNFVKALLRANISVDFSVFFSLEVSKKKNIIKEKVIEIKKEEIPKNNEIKTEEKTPEEIKTEINKEKEVSGNASSDFDMMSCLAGMFENF